MIRVGAVLLLVSLTAAALGGCATYRDQLHRGQRYYDENRYETALALWRDLEGNQDSLEKNERVQYAYFRGMTDYRLGYRADARYWLGLASAGEKLTPDSLQSDEKARLAETLEELNTDVYGTGGDIPAAPEATETPAAVAPTDSVGASCKWSSDCAAGQTCQDGVCVEL